MRVFAMLMVVALHSLCYYGNWGFKECVVQPYLDLSSLLNDIAMPLFMCISGYLFSKSLSKQEMSFVAFVKKKFNRLIIPYLVWGGVQILLMPERYSLRQLLFGVSHLWFLLTLFWIFVIMYALKDYWNKFETKSNLLLIVVIFCLYPWFKYSHNVLRISSVIKYLPYFIMGIMVYKNQIVKSYIIKVLIALVSFSMLIFIRFEHYDFFNNFVVYELCQVLGWLLIYVLFDFVLNIHFPDSNIVSYMDDLSMGIYIIHHIVILYCLQFVSVKTFLNDYWQIGPVAIFFVALIISIVLATLLTSNKVTGKIIG